MWICSFSLFWFCKRKNVYIITTYDFYITDILYDSSPPPSVEYSWDLEFSDSTCNLEVSTEREENLEPTDNLTLIHNRNESPNNGKVIP